MNPLWLITQDHDAVIHYDKAHDALYTLPQITDGVYMGINLYCSSSFLGTFDSVQEAVMEIDKIQQCTELHYFINDFKDWEDIGNGSFDWEVAE
ncbi:hypothetical protein MHBO_004866 [Bonamia ostreae]|uniref:Uncharacterized protein n=1 Tax=Bonamia ostreae TaxID=126728 RepID=A0ABV2AUH3_9EUKA